MLNIITLSNNKLSIKLAKITFILIFRKYMIEFLTFTIVIIKVNAGKYLIYLIMANFYSQFSETSKMKRICIYNVYRNINSHKNL